MCSNSSTLINSKEEELLRNYSSSRSYNEKNKKIFSVVKNECVETTQQNSPQQKSSLGDDFDASEGGMERDWELDYSDTALPEPPEYAVADFGLAGGELDYGHIPPDASKPIETPLSQPTASEISEPQQASIKNAKNRTNKTISMQDLMQLISSNTKEERPMSISQTKLEPRQVSSDNYNYRILVIKKSRYFHIIFLRFFLLIYENEILQVLQHSFCNFQYLTLK